MLFRYLLKYFRLLRVPDWNFLPFMMLFHSLDFPAAVIITENTPLDICDVWFVFSYSFIPWLFNKCIPVVTYYLFPLPPRPLSPLGLLFSLPDWASTIGCPDLLSLVLNYLKQINIYGHNNFVVVVLKRRYINLREFAQRQHNHQQDHLCRKRGARSRKQESESRFSTGGGCPGCPHVRGRLIAGSSWPSRIIN